MKHTIQSISSTIIEHFTGNRLLSAAIAKWVAANTLHSLQKNSLIMPLTSDDKQDTFASQLKKYS